MPCDSVKSLSFKKLVSKINYNRLNNGKSRLSSEKIAIIIIKKGGSYLENELIEF